MRLRYGLNPHQHPATVEALTADRPPIRVLHGEPSYLNLLDALNAWPLVRDAARLLGRPAATSFKHVSPAGAAVAGPPDPTMISTYQLPAAGVDAVTSAYIRARDADPGSSYGDLVAVSHPVSADLADLLRGLVSDGIVAPGYDPGTVATLAAKKNRRFLVLEADPAYEPPATEIRDVFGLRLRQPRDVRQPSHAELATAATGPLPGPALDDLLLGLITMRHTQSNSVVYVRAGMALGIGAGQQSRIDCTRLAGTKTDRWWLRRHPAIADLSFPMGTRTQDRVTWQLSSLDDDPIDGATPLALTAPERQAWLDRLDGVSFVSDGAIPFRDNVDHARRHGVRYLAEPGGSVRSEEVARACAEHGITLTRTGVRQFHH